jgi:hypothetical protein
MTMFSPARQAEIVSTLSTHPQACAVRKNQLTKNWLSRSPRSMTMDEFKSLPLVRAIENDFTTAGIFAGYELRVRKPIDASTLTECVLPPLPPWEGIGEPPAWEARLMLPPLPGRYLTRLAIGIQRYRASIADTAGTLDVLPIHIVDAATNRPVDLEKTPLDLSKGGPIEFRVDHSEQIPRNVPLFARLYDAAGLFDVVPVLEDH